MTHSSAKQSLERVKYFWLFLDEMESVSKSAGGQFANIKNIKQLPGTVWALFKEWLSAHPNAIMADAYYFQCKRAFDFAAKKLLGPDAAAAGFPLPANPFPQVKSSDRARQTPSRSYTDRELQHVVGRLRSHVARAEERLNEAFGKIRNADSDPEGKALFELRSLAESVAWRQVPRKLSHTRWRAIRPSGCDLRSTNFDRLLRIAPSSSEMSAIFGLVLMRSGWNFSTLWDMPADHWHCPHPIRPNQIEQIFSKKVRAGGRTQYTYSLRHEPYHAFHLISLAHEWTKPLRTAILQQIEDLTQRKRSDTEQTRLDKLNNLKNRIWLCTGRAGDISSIPHRYIDEIKILIRQDSDEFHQLDFNQSLTRDSWAAFAYESSGYNVLVTQIALGHTDLRSLLSYLEQKAILNQHRKKFFDFQRQVLTSVSTGSLDPEVIRSLLADNCLTSAQLATLAEGRTVSRQGLMCADPTNPDPEVEPDHKAGELCVNQNCLAGCSNAYATRDCLDYVMGRICQLKDLRKRIPIPAWTHSTFPHDLQFLEEIAAFFSDRNRREALERAKLIRQ